MAELAMKTINFPLYTFVDLVNDVLKVPDTILHMTTSFSTK